MPLLVVLDSIHYSPKDYERATKEILIAADGEQALAYIDKEHLLDFFAEFDEADDDEASCCPEDSWWDKNPNKKSEALSLGLEIDEYGYVEGRADILTRWLCSDNWKDTNDAFYGITHYDWSKQQEISEVDASTLLRLGLAKDIRNES